MAVDYPDDLDRRVNAIGRLRAGDQDLRCRTGLRGRSRRTQSPAGGGVAEACSLTFPIPATVNGRSAMIYRNWAYALYAYSDYLPTAEHAFSESIEILEKLSLSDPKRPGVWFYLADTYV